MLSKLLRSKIRNYRDDGYNLINCNFSATNSLFCDEWFSDLGYLWVAQARDLRQKQADDILHQTYMLTFPYSLIKTSKRGATKFIFLKRVMANKVYILRHILSGS